MGETNKDKLVNEKLRKYFYYKRFEKISIISSVAKTKDYVIYKPKLFNNKFLKNVIVLY